MSAPIFHLFAFLASVLMIVAILKQVNAILIALGAVLAMGVVHVSFLYKHWQLKQRVAERAAATRVGFITGEDFRKTPALGLKNQHQYDKSLERTGQRPR